MKLNPKEAPSGYEARMTDSDTRDCTGCALYGRVRCFAAACTPTMRKDRCSVHFVKLRKPKLKPARKPVVMWVVAVPYLINRKLIYRPYAAMNRASSRYVVSESKKHGVSYVRGPVKVVLP